jgi:PHD/YefM family antitoxin component YafN of YafNO toxin-antitoxin module
LIRERFAYNKLKTGHNYGTITSQKGVDIMPHIIPIRDLKKTSEISQMCKASNEPIFVTKNGYGDMVLMSMNVYEQKMYLLDVHDKLSAAETQINEGKVLNADTSLKRLREKYNV